MSKLLIKNVELLHTPNGEMNYIAIEDDKIVYVGTEVPAAFEDAEVLDGAGKLATAGTHQVRRTVLPPCPGPQ